MGMFGIKGLLQWVLKWKEKTWHITTKNISICQTLWVPHEGQHKTCLSSQSKWKSRCAWKCSRKWKLQQKRLWKIYLVHADCRHAQFYWGTWVHDNFDNEINVVRVLAHAELCTATICELPLLLFCHFLVNDSFHIHISMMKQLLTHWY